MQLTQQEINRNRLISGSVTLLIFFLIILFLILYKIITPNPPFPLSGGGGGQELALGMMMVGNDDIDFGSMGNVTDVVAEKTATKEEVVTVEGGEDVQVEENKPEVKNDRTVITPVKPKEVVPEKKESEKLSEKFRKNLGRNGGGIGNTNTPGDAGDAEGEDGKTGNGGTGTGSDGGDGPGKGPGGGPGFGGGKYGFDLGGRSVVVPPKLPSDTKEDGKVVVNIVVDSEGNVIEAIPNGRGTDTKSAILKAKAKQAALATKFNVDGKYAEQHGTITIIFTYQ